MTSPSPISVTSVTGVAGFISPYAIAACSKSPRGLHSAVLEREPVTQGRGARTEGNRPAGSGAAFSFRWVSIFLITTGSSMQAITFTAPPHSLHVSISMLKTRFSRCAQVMAARRSACVWCCASTRACCHLPRLAGVTRARCLLLGANTPWKRVRFTLGFGTSAASLAMKSSGSKMTWVVPSL